MADTRQIRSLEANDTLVRLLEANGTKFLKDLDKDQITKRFGHNLPHWTFDGAAYHVRFRLFDSIPIRIQRELMDEKVKLLNHIHSPGNGFTLSEKRRLILLFTEKVDRILDQGYGDCRLAEKPISDLVSGALKFFEGERYILYSWCVMPNHVHAVVQPLTKFGLPQILHSWKSYTANQANKILHRTGSFWQREYYDHMLRDIGAFIGCVNYVYENPDKAGLSDWEWRFRIDSH